MEEAYKLTLERVANGVSQPFVNTALLSTIREIIANQTRAEDLIKKQQEEIKHLESVLFSFGSLPADYWTCKIFRSK